MIPLPAMLMKPQNPLYTDADRLAAWEHYEVTSWIFAVRVRGLHFTALEPAIQRAILARVDESPKAIGA